MPTLIYQIMFSIGWSIFSVSDNSAQHIKIVRQCFKQSQPVSFREAQLVRLVYVVNASDLKAVTEGNVLCKYADDTYAIIPSDNVRTRTTELDNSMGQCEQSQIQSSQMCRDHLLRQQAKTITGTASPLPNFPRI